MIWGCEKIGGCGMNIDSLDFVPKQRFKGFLETLMRGWCCYNGVKKTDMRRLREDRAEFLRSVIP